MFSCLKYEIQYEPEHFRFTEPYRRSIDYCPDFFIREATEERLVEVKSWLDGSSKTRLLGFRKFYPERAKKLLVVTRDSANVEWIKTHFSKAEL